MAEHGEGALAVAAHDARRAAGLTVEAVAARSGLDPSVVRTVEAGGAVGEPDMRSLCVALSLPIEHHAGGVPFGPLSDVRPVDQEHAAFLRVVAAESVDDAWLVTPDVPAWDSDPAVLAVTGIDRGEAGRVDSLSGWIGVPSLLLTFVLVFVDIGMASDGQWFFLGAAVLIQALLALLFRTLYRWDQRSGHGPLSRLKEHEAARKAAMLKGYLVGADRLCVLTVGSKGIEREVHHVAAMSDVGLEEVGSGHVTVKFRTLFGGDVVMPWLPRCRDLLDTVDAWRRTVTVAAPGVNGDAHGRDTLLEGPQ